jgi:hypothetical protein
VRFLGAGFFLAVALRFVVGIIYLLCCERSVRPLIVKCIVSKDFAIVNN